MSRRRPDDPDRMGGPVIEGSRVCPVCGESLEGRRADARYCGSVCRREARRVRALLTGRSDGPYRTLREYVNRRQRRAKRALRPPWGS